MTATWKARPTTYNGVQMRSRLEARAAAKFDELEWAWTYEPRAFADETGQYLPDFQIETYPGDPGVYVEVKPTIEAALAVMARMQIIRSSEPDAKLFILIPGAPCYIGNPGEPWRLGRVMVPA